MTSGGEASFVRHGSSFYALQPPRENSMTDLKTQQDDVSANGSDAEPTAVWRSTNVHVSLLTGGGDRPYVFGLATALATKGIDLDVIGSDEVDSPEFHNDPLVHFLNLRGEQRSDVPLVRKIARVLVYYWRLLCYASSATPKIFHILWDNKFELFDRTVLMLFYKFLGKRIVITAHNVNSGKRDGNDSAMNRFGLRMRYRLADHVFVHTAKMKDELMREFNVGAERISVIPFGINNSVPTTSLTCRAARRRLGLGDDDKVILFFGGILPYKGLDYLIDAFLRLAAQRPEYRLIIAGRLRSGAESYFEQIQRRIEHDPAGARILRKIEFVRDEDTELYFKAADVLALPYTHVFQSGVLFLGYSFGLPVIATDVGSIREDVIEGRTGFICSPRDAADLAATIEKYFASDLFKSLDTCRRRIRDYANAKYSWQSVAHTTSRVYEALL